MDYKILTGGVSSTGKVRKMNQDSAYIGKNLFLVADGMGGHLGGEIASTIAVKTIAVLDEKLSKIDNITTALRMLEKRFEYAHNIICAFAKKNPKLEQMGTTISALIVLGEKIALAHLGDSSIYLYSNGILTKKTHDHSVVQELIDIGQIDEQEAKNHPKRNIVTKVLGFFDSDMIPDISIHTTVIGDRYLLASDGLTGVVNDIKITNILKNSTNPALCAKKLLKQSIQNDSADNITAIIVDISDKSKTKERRPEFLGSATYVDLKKIWKNALDSAENDEPQANDINTKKIKKKQQKPYKPLKIKFYAILAAIILVLGISYYLANSYISSKYYITNHNDRIVIYQGIPTKIGPISLSKIYSDYETNLSMSDLDDVTKNTVNNIISFSNIEDAKNFIQKIKDNNLEKYLVSIAPDPPVLSPKSTTEKSTPKKTKK